MGKRLNIHRSDDYATLETTVGTFYFGYESAKADGEWRFTFTYPDGTEVCNLTSKELGCSREFSWDDSAEILLCGIGRCIDKGLIKQEGC